MDIHTKASIRQCYRCGEVFWRREELVQHRRSQNSCFLRNDNDFEKEGVEWETFGIIEDIANRPSIGTGSDADKWRSIFRILFPGAYVPSPCTPFRDVWPDQD